MAGAYQQPAAHGIGCQRPGQVLFGLLAWLHDDRAPAPCTAQPWTICRRVACLLPASPLYCSRSALAGEYRGIMNLCRVLPLGLDAKAAVDEAINRWVLCAAVSHSVLS